MYIQWNTNYMILIHYFVASVCIDCPCICFPHNYVSCDYTCFWINSLFSIASWMFCQANTLSSNSGLTFFCECFRFFDSQYVLVPTYSLLLMNIYLSSIISVTTPLICSYDTKQHKDVLFVVICIFLNLYFKPSHQTLAMN